MDTTEWLPRRPQKALISSFTDYGPDVFLLVVVRTFCSAEAVPRCAHIVRHYCQDTPFSTISLFSLCTSMQATFLKASYLDFVTSSLLPWIRLKAHRHSTRAWPVPSTLLHICFRALQPQLSSDRKSGKVGPPTDTHSRSFSRCLELCRFQDWGDKHALILPCVPLNRPMSFPMK